MAKQHKLPFPISETRASKDFDIIYCDIWGPYSKPSLDGSHYFLTIVDDYSRVTWTYLMKTKSQTRPIIHNFYSLIQTHFETNVKTLRSDNGAEFLMIDFYHSKGILHHVRCVETPQQNGIVERKHQHILNIAIALKFKANLPHKFWGNCILTATHLINRTPSFITQHLLFPTSECLVACAMLLL